MRRSEVTERVLDLAALAAEVSHGGAGAVATFVGTVREENGGRRVSGIDYSAYTAMANRELDTIAAVATARYPRLRLVIEHRVGTLVVGEASVIIAASHPHRAEALAAVQFALEELKKRVPIWKREHYADGTREWVHASSSRATEDGTT
jgi:molybdopterin synthase catalytic subunit